jgi:LysR family transcriptional regulator of gallate degradation
MVDELLARVSAGTIEFAVMASPEQPSPEGLEQEMLISTELEVVARKGHPLLRRPRLGLSDLLAYPWILPSGAASGRQGLYRSFSALGLPLPVPTIESDSITYISSFLQDSDYLSFLPLSLVGAHDGMQELSPLRIEDQHWLRPLAATYRKGMLLSKSSRQLVAHIQREVVKLESQTWALRAGARSGAATS